MQPWIVVGYDDVDIRQTQDREPRFAPGSPISASVVEHASDSEAAIKSVALGRGFFAAFPMPSCDPVEVTMEIRS